MFKKFFGISLAVILMISTIAGCGASKSKNSTSADYIMAPAAQEMDMQKGDYNGAVDAFGANGQRVEATVEAEAAEEPAQPNAIALADSLAGAGSSIDNMSSAILNERKIIRSANLTIEVENFDEAYNNINSIILGIGIVQESNISTERIYIEEKLKLIKSGTILLRVNKDKFDSVVNSLKGIGDVYNQAINGQDVTDRFVDTESRLRLLKLEQGRLEAYLMKLEDLEKIFRTESRLTEIRQEIESLTGNLNKMSSLVELSTITITMNEKRPDSINPLKPLTYGQKLIDNLKSSLEGVLTFLGELLIFVVAAIPVLLLLGLFLLLGVFIYKRIPKKQKETVTVMKKESTEQKKEE